MHVFLHKVVVVQVTLGQLIMDHSYCNGASHNLINVRVTAPDSQRTHFSS